MTDIYAELLELLYEQHPPATGWDDAVLEASTADILEMLTEFCTADEKLSEEELSTALRDKGYIVAMRPGHIAWVWLLK